MMIKIQICLIYIKIIFVIISERIFYHHLERDENLEMFTFLIIQKIISCIYYLQTKM